MNDTTISKCACQTALSHPAAIGSRLTDPRLDQQLHFVFISARLARGKVKSGEHV